LVLLLVLASSMTAFGIARSVRDDNERRLLNLQADEITSLFQSLAGQYQSAVTTASVVAQRSNGDPSEYASFVGTIQASQGGTWFLLHRDADGRVTPTTSVGPSDATPVLATNRTPDVDAQLDQAFSGNFVVVGIFGTGAARTLAMAGGVPGATSSDIAYVEYSLLAAAASSTQTSDQSNSTMQDLDMALYLNDQPTDANLIFATTPTMHDTRSERLIHVGAKTLLLVVSAKHPLSGELTTKLPWVLLLVGLLGGGAIFFATEATSRRRDRAVRTAVELEVKNDELDNALIARDALEADVRRSREELIQRLAWAADFKDPETASHLKRMSLYSEMLGRLAGLSKERCEQLRLAAPMHDIGKIGIPDDILAKPGKYTPDDREVMKRHALIGYRILAGSDSELVELAAVVALNHHEWFDGSGYPSGTVGETIPIEARIVAIADVFDALTTRRRYKSAMSVDDALSTMIDEKGHFDPTLLRLFIGARADVEAIQMEFADDHGIDEADVRTSVLGLRS